MVGNNLHKKMKTKKILFNRGDNSDDLDLESNLEVESTYHSDDLESDLEVDSTYHSDDLESDLEVDSTEHCDDLEFDLLSIEVANNITKEEEEYNEQREQPLSMISRLTAFFKCCSQSEKVNNNEVKGYGI